jgi:hypothetical protein
MTARNSRDVARFRPRTAGGQAEGQAEGRGQAPRMLHGAPAAPNAQPEPQPLPEPGPGAAEVVNCHIRLHFMADGKELASQAIPANFPKPGPNEVRVLEVALDVRALIRDLEPKLGPQQRGPALWVPGMPVPGRG